MSSAERDRTARSRIRRYLAEHGPIVDPSGRATALLKDAVDYQGSAVAFIQLITAMDKGAEIEREIRGKRTYRITGLDSLARGVSAPYRPPAAQPAVAHSATRSVSRAGAASGLGVDYDKLARALLRETWRLAELGDARVASADEAREMEVAKQERDQLIIERDEYARRLKQLGVMINGLASAFPEAGEQSGRLLAGLRGAQENDRRKRAS
jgi:hypothetical protein